MASVLVTEEKWVKIADAESNDGEMLVAIMNKGTGAQQIDLTIGDQSKTMTLAVQGRTACYHVTVPAKSYTVGKVMAKVYGASALGCYITVMGDGIV